MLSCNWGQLGSLRPSIHQKKKKKDKIEEVGQLVEHLPWKTECLGFWGKSKNERWGRRLDSHADCSCRGLRFSAQCLRGGRLMTICNSSSWYLTPSSGLCRNDTCMWYTYIMQVKKKCTHKINLKKQSWGEHFATPVLRRKERDRWIPLGFTSQVD